MTLPDRQPVDRQQTARTASGDRQRQSWRDRQRDELAVAGEPPAPRAGGFANAGGELVDRQPATHRIVASDYDDADEDDEPGAGGALATLSGLRFVHQSPGSLLDQIDYARDGAYTIQVDGWWRTANIWFARLIAFPGLALCHLVAWALFTRLSRTLISVVIIPLALMLANGLPVVSWAVPDWADFTTWWTPAPEPAPGAVG